MLSWDTTYHTDKSRGGNPGDPLLMVLDVINLFPLGGRSGPQTWGFSTLLRR